MLEPTGGIDIVPRGSPLAGKLESTYRKHGLSWEHLSAENLPERFPQFQPQEELQWEALCVFLLALGTIPTCLIFTDCCVFFARPQNRYQPDAGVVRATNAVLALFAAAESTGRVDVFEGQNVSQLVPHGKGTSWLVM